MMENVSVLGTTSIMGDLLGEIKSGIEKISYGRTSFSPAIANMIAEEGSGFYSYLNRLGFAGDTELMILSSKHHYYYDESELKEIKTLVNMKKLNLIKHLDSFLNTLSSLLPEEATFIGCFSDSRDLRMNGRPFSHTSLLMHRFINIIDSRTDRRLDADQVREILESRGFRIFDMTEIDGTTYFYCKPCQKPASQRA